MRALCLVAVARSSRPPVAEWGARRAWELHKEGKTKGQIADALGCHKDTVKKILRFRRKTGTHRVSHQGQNKKRDKRCTFAGVAGVATVASLDKLRSEHDDGGTNKEVHSAFLHLGYQTSYRQLCHVLHSKLNYTGKAVRSHAACCLYLPTLLLDA